MNAELVFGLYLFNCFASRALQKVIVSKFATHESSLVNVWKALSANKVILFVEAANLLELLLNLSLFGISENEVQDSSHDYVLLWGLVGLMTLLLLCFSLKVKQQIPGFNFRLSEVERYPEVLIYLFIKLLVSCKTLNGLTATISVLVTYHAVLITLIDQEISLAFSFRENYVQFWKNSRTVIPLLDGALELVFRLKGFIPATERSRASIVKAWPGLFHL